MDNLKVVAIRRDGDGNISEYKLSNGEEITKKVCESYIGEGKLNLVCAKGRSGSTVIRSSTDSVPSLADLPTF